jgi:hypothetical protein
MLINLLKLAELSRGGIGSGRAAFGGEEFARAPQRRRFRKAANAGSLPNGPLPSPLTTSSIEAVGWSPRTKLRRVPLLLHHLQWRRAQPPGAPPSV